MHVTTGSFALKSNNSAVCCSLYGAGLGRGPWVRQFTWQWVGLGWVSYLVGWVWVDDMDPQKTVM